MINTYHIASYCLVKNGKIELNGEELYASETNDFKTFSKLAYKVLEIDYPKFFKMDALSKLAFLAAETILKPLVIDKNQHDIALLFSNKASSLDTDRKHQKSISEKENYFPSPSVFVYTLPNICIGEICIRHKLFSENSFFIFDAFNAEHLLINTNSLLKQKKAEKVLCGWVDVDNENYEAFLYLVEKQGSIEHNIEEIKRLHKNLWKS